jgi:hypothetical protein
MITWEENWKIIPQLLDEKKVVLPLMLWELLRYQLINSETTDKWMLGWFLKYFQTRYGKLFDRLGFSYRDFIKNHIWIRNKENKAKVSEILVLLQS